MQLTLEFHDLVVQRIPFLTRLHTNGEVGGLVAQLLVHRRVGNTRQDDTIALALHLLHG